MPFPIAARGLALGVLLVGVAGCELFLDTPSAEVAFAQALAGTWYATGSTTETYQFSGTEHLRLRYEIEDAGEVLSAGTVAVRPTAELGRYRLRYTETRGAHLPPDLARLTDDCDTLILTGPDGTPRRFFEAPGFFDGPCRADLFR